MPVADLFAFIVGRQNRSVLARACSVALASAALIAPFAGSASAQGWTGNTSSDWTDGANWSSGTVPIAGIVTINTNSPRSAVLGMVGPATGSTGNFSIGLTAAGDLTIQNGSTLTTTGAIVRLGLNGFGTVTVTGTGSLWDVTTAQLVVGLNGVGIVNIQNGGQVTARDGLLLGQNATGSGTLNISGGGILETTALGKGSGTGQVNLNGGILRARGGNANFITGFAAGELNLAAGGLTVDTAGFNLGTDATSGFSGIGGLTVTGGGIFNLAAINTYAGDTQIDAGSTLALTGVGSVATSRRLVADGTFDISGLTGTGTSIQSLAGSGDVGLGTKDLTITSANDLFSGIISGSGGLTISGGTETFSGGNNYTGATTVAGGVLRAGAANTFSAASAFSVLSGGTLDLAGFNQTLVSLGNAGTVNLGGAPGTVLTIAGNYVGNGGALQINSKLGGDGSPSDLLRVQGNTSGSTLLRVNNVGGTGAPTVNGIEVVDVAGASAGTFALQGDYVFKGEQAVIAGAYAYTLQQNGINTADGDWYLRSSLIDPPPGTPEGPLYAPTVPIYEVYSQVLLGLNDLPTLQQRVGNRYWDGTGSNTAGTSGTWARIEGRHSEYEADHSTTGSSFESDQFKLQSGIDGLVVENDAGRLLAGVNFQYGTASADVRLRQWPHQCGRLWCRRHADLVRSRRVLSGRPGTRDVVQ